MGGKRPVVVGVDVGNSMLWSLDWHLQRQYYSTCIVAPIYASYWSCHEADEQNLQGYFPGKGAPGGYAFLKGYCSIAIVRSNLALILLLRNAWPKCRKNGFLCWKFVENLNF